MHRIMSSKKFDRQLHIPLLLLSLLLIKHVKVCHGQDDSFGSSTPSDGDSEPAAPPPQQNNCNGIFMSYTFISREKLYPHIKNVSAQAWGFESEATIVNTGTRELKQWKMFIGFQHRELLVSASGAVTTDGGDFPTPVGNGTTLAGYPMVDLKTAIDTAGDFTQISTKIEFKGTQFGLSPKATPMPRTIRLANDGYKCPAPTRRGKNTMMVCCIVDPKYKMNDTKKTKYFPKQNGDLSLMYDILESYGNNYLAQVTIDNNNPLGRLDRWNLTWEWMRGEFIQTMRGAYTRKKDISECIFGLAGQYFKDMDFSQVMSCEKNPIIGDLPPDRANDTKIGKIPYCCRNGSVLPTVMDPSKARSIFQLQVFKLPPDQNRTALTPPQKWKVDGAINPNYKCGPPLRVEPTVFPDPSGLQATSNSIASWQVICNITRPKERQNRCCVSYTAYNSDTVIPCPTCACGCENTDNCNPDAKAMHLPPEALLVPFENRTAKAKAWAELKKKPIPKKLPCSDNCGVSINWHLQSDYTTGWAAKMTIFNWLDEPFVDWFTVVELKNAGDGFDKVYSFNGTKLPKNDMAVLFQGLKYDNYLVAIKNASNPEKSPKIPGKQQSVISFKKKKLHGLNIRKGDGFPSKLYFNGEQCALPSELPLENEGHRTGIISYFTVIVVAFFTFLLTMDLFHW